MALTAGLNGRMEKRLHVIVVVHLGDVQDHPVNAAELTYTENVSAHGACVISKRAWQPGEPAEVTSFKEKVGLRGKVVHCRKCNNERYVVGLTFEGSEVTWAMYREYASS
jgi:methyl coenzyme M reductase subunit C